MKALLFIFFIASPALNAFAETDFLRDSAAPGNMRFAWIHGSKSAKANRDVRIQVHRYNEHTYILRQNPAIHWEAPFMYLLFGNKRALLIDAGATEEPQYFPLYETVALLIKRWERANRIELDQLTVLPLGSEPSQVGGLKQFLGIPKVEVQENYKLEQKIDTSSLNLGGRVLTVIETPGLNENGKTIYDPWTDILFTSTSFYPGRLVIRNYELYRDSLKRLVSFSEKNPIAFIAGGRIEMSSTPGLDYILRTNYRPNERRLELSPRSLIKAHQVINLINGKESIQIEDDFIVMNAVGRGARAYGWPVFIPEKFDKPNPR